MSFEVQSALQIAKEVFDSGPVLFARIGVEASELGDSEGDVWTSTSSQIHQSSHSIDVWQLAHLSALLSIRGTHLFRKAQARLHRSMNRSAAAESEPLEHVDDVLMLGEGDGTIGTISDDLDAQNFTNRTNGGRGR